MRDEQLAEIRALAMRVVRHGLTPADWRRLGDLCAATGLNRGAVISDALDLWEAQS